MKDTSIKKMEEKVEKKKAKLQALLESKHQIEIKIKAIKAEIKDFESRQFEYLQKAAQKENIEIKMEDIPSIIQMMKDMQKNKAE